MSKSSNKNSVIEGKTYFSQFPELTMLLHTSPLSVTTSKILVSFPSKCTVLQPGKYFDNLEPVVLMIPDMLINQLLAATFLIYCNI